MSICDLCPKPGACCKSLVLFFNGEAITDEVEGLETLASEVGNNGFIPYSKNDLGDVLWTCSWLDKRGRCSRYSERPDVCRQFYAGSDKLCVLYKEKAA